MQHEFVTVKEAAKVVRASEFTVRRWIVEGRIPAVRVAEHGPHLIRATDLSRILGLDREAAAP